MRTITHIVVHCTATAQTATVRSLQKYWREFLGWKSPGYHKVVMPDGTVITLAEDAKVVNGAKGYNAHSLHVSYMGGVIGNKPFDNRTMEQRASLLRIVREWKCQHPQAEILGHRDFLTRGKPGWKDCPCFDAREEYALV